MWNSSVLEKADRCWLTVRFFSIDLISNPLVCLEGCVRSHGGQTFHGLEAAQDFVRTSVSLT